MWIIYHELALIALSTYFFFQNVKAPGSRNQHNNLFTFDQLKSDDYNVSIACDYFDIYVLESHKKDFTTFHQIKDYLVTLHHNFSIIGFNESWLSDINSCST